MSATVASGSVRHSNIATRVLAHREFVLITAVLTKLALHLPIAHRYGMHGDEYYFLDCAKNLAWGYVDHPPLVPWIVRACTSLFGNGIVAARLPFIVAGALAIALTIAVVRELGGNRKAEAIAAAAMLAAPAMLRMSTMITIPSLELVLWTGSSLMVLRILNGASPRWWLAVGGLAGLGLLNKYTMLIWGVALVVGLALTAHRKWFRSAWFWAGGAITVAIIAPNIAWQAANDWPSLAFIQNMRGGRLASIPRALFILGQVLYLNPLGVPIWLLGLVKIWRMPRARPLAIAFVAAFVILLITGAKPYYLAPAYPVLFAAGGIAVGDGLQRLSRHFRRTVVTLWALCVAPLIALSLPIFDLRSVDDAFEYAFGAIVPPIALTHDLHSMYGWREQAQSIASVVDKIEPARRARTRILVGNYGQASALHYYQRELGLPRAVSGHLNHHLWGIGQTPTDTEPLIDTLIVYGVPSEVVQQVCTDPRQEALIDHPLANSRERKLPVYVCTPRVPLREVWPSLRHFGHGGGKSTAKRQGS